MKIAYGIVCSFFVFFCVMQSLVYAEDAKLDMRIGECKDLIDEIMQMPEKSIPEDLLAKASGIAIFPSVIKGGFVFGGNYGKGIVMHRDKKTGVWSAPSFYTIAGGSWGLQIGGQLVDLVLVITNERGMKGLLQDKFTLGTDAAASAGPVGRNAEIGTDVLLKASILSYSRSKGLFAGVTIKGAVVAPDNKANELYYGKPLSAEEIIMQNKAKPSKKAAELIDTIKSYSKK